MFSLSALIVCIAISCLPSIHGWQQSDSEYNDDPLSVLPSGGWKEGQDKRNTWWTKKSVSDEEHISGCTVEKCMLMLMDCLRRAENKAIFLHCKESHITCLASCFQKYREKFMFNTVGMAS